MPELPEVETTRRGLAMALEGKRIDAVAVRVPALRFPIPDNLAATMTGRRIESFERRAKYLLIRLDDGHVVIGHLGMSGRMRILPPGGADDIMLEKHDHVVLRADDGTELRFNDARRFGFLLLSDADTLGAHPMLAGLGPEPLGNEFNGPALAAALKGRRSPIKAALLDQRNVAGLGNIYVCEALYRAELSPRRSAHTVQGRRAERLAAAIRDVLEEAIAAGGSSLRDFRHADGELGYFQKSFHVYGREGESCPRCAAEGVAEPCIRRMVQSGRSTFYCSRWQR